MVYITTNADGKTQYHDGRGGIFDSAEEARGSKSPALLGVPSAEPSLEVVKPPAQPAPKETVVPQGPVEKYKTPKKPTNTVIITPTNNPSMC